MTPVKNTAMEDKVLKGVLYSEKKAGRLSLGFVTLDSSRSLNALDLRMLHSIEKKLLNWRRRDDIACVVLSANSKKAFCAGGDIKSLVAGLHQDKLSQFARDYFTTEYFVDYLIHVYPKPILCWADGITMGGGIGIMNGALVSCRYGAEPLGHAGDCHRLFYRRRRYLFSEPIAKRPRFVSRFDCGPV